VLVSHVSHLIREHALVTWSEGFGVDFGGWRRAAGCLGRAGVVPSPLCTLPSVPLLQKSVCRQTRWDGWLEVFCRSIKRWDWLFITELRHLLFCKFFSGLHRRKTGFFTYIWS